VTPTEGYVETDDGIRLFFQTVGDGARVVLFPNGIYLLEDFARFANGRTLVFFDVRNRGRSDSTDDRAKLAKGIHHDVDDLETVRLHFGADRVDVVAHSYVGVTAVLYAMKHPTRVGRVLQIGPMGPFSDRKYPPHLSGDDDTRREVLRRLSELEQERSRLDRVAFCRKFWTQLRVLYVFDPADVHKILKWERCDLPNELNLMKYLMEDILPSIHRLKLTPEDFSKVTMPVMTVHGTNDRSAPYGGGRDWAMMLPNARLVTVHHAAHAPWIEAPERVYRSIETFLNGEWPEDAETVTSRE
jgi:proline iminopeptidase